MRLPFEVVPAGNSLQRKTDEIFEKVSNIFEIEENIFVVGYDDSEAYYNMIRRQVLTVCEGDI